MTAKLPCGAGPLLAWLLLWTSGVGLAADPREILIDAPRTREVATTPGGLAFVSGRLTPPAGQGGLDLVLALDVSDSTDAPLASSPAAARLHARPSRFERLLLSLRGPARPRPDATLLAEEVRLARALLERLDPRTTRVALVGFAGDRDPSTADAWTVAPLSADFERLDRGLDQLLQRGPRGLTELGAGVNRAMAELLATKSAASESRGTVRRAVLVLTDGVGPPRFTTTSPSYLSRQRRRIRRAIRAGIRVDVVVVGEEALRQPLASEAWFQRTGGQLVTVPDRASEDLLASTLDYRGTHSLAVRNLTSGLEARAVEITPDGGFACLAPLVSGLNRIELRVELSDRSLVRVLELRPADLGEPDLPLRQLAQRNRLLREHLRALHARPPAHPTPRPQQLEIAVPAASGAAASD